MDELYGLAILLMRITSGVWSTRDLWRFLPSVE